MQETINSIDFAKVSISLLYNEIKKKSFINDYVSIYSMWLMLILLFLFKYIL